MTGPFDIPFLGVAIGSKETQRFDDDLPTVVSSNPNFRIAGAAVCSFILGGRRRTYTCLHITGE